VEEAAPPAAVEEAAPLAPVDVTDASLTPKAEEPAVDSGIQSASPADAPSAQPVDVDASAPEQEQLSRQGSSPTPASAISEGANEPMGVEEAHKSPMAAEQEPPAQQPNPREADPSTVCA
jgi:hypothetical protein